MDPAELKRCRAQDQARLRPDPETAERRPRSEEMDREWPAGPHKGTFSLRYPDGVIEGECVDCGGRWPEGGFYPGECK